MERTAIAYYELSNNPRLFLRGGAGTGKTHLLCDLVENCFAKEKVLPAVLVFGENFKTTEDPFTQIVRQLELELGQEEFFKLLNESGKKSKCRALLIIDALNEAPVIGYWIKNLSILINKIKDFPNIALIVSCRHGFDREVLSEELTENFVYQEHQGFAFKEWEAINKFFHYFHLPLPEVPLITPEFQNPLFLLLFCKAFENKGRAARGKEIFRGHEGATHIFENFIKNISEKIAKKFNIPTGGGKNIWDKVIEKIAEEMVSSNTDRLSENIVLKIASNAYPNVNHNEFIKDLDKNFLLVKVPKPNGSGFEFKFPFQKFSDHLIGRYIFKKYEKEFGKGNENLMTAKKFFSARRKLGKHLLNPQNQGLVEALSIYCPERLKGHDLIEVAPYLQENHIVLHAFIESIIWRKATAFSKDLKKIIKYFNRKIIISNLHDKLLNAFLAITAVHNHPFNANFLHQHLIKIPMPKRDAWWSVFLHEQQNTYNSVDRLIDWAWSFQDKQNISKEAIELCSVTLCWFFTTPNRFVRDKATKAMISILTNKLNIVLNILKKFKEVDDPYVAERVYAVAYGCAMCSVDDNNKENLKELAIWVYSNIFESRNPPVHILLRDYARGVIEVALHREIPLHIDIDLIRPPYRSKWIRDIPTNEAINKFKIVDDIATSSAKAINMIFFSMQVQSGDVNYIHYGDFGRYIFESALNRFNWSKKQI